MFSSFQLFFQVLNSKKMSLLRGWGSDLWGALTNSGIFSETASTTMDTEDTLSLPESLRREYHDLRTKVAEEKKPKEVAEDEGMKLQENEAGGDNDEDDNASVCSSTLSGSSSCGDVEELFSDSGLESGGSVDDVNLAAAATGVQFNRHIRTALTSALTNSQKTRP